MAVHKNPTLIHPLSRRFQWNCRPNFLFRMGTTFKYIT